MEVEVEVGGAAYFCRPKRLSAPSRSPTKMSGYEKMIEPEMPVGGEKVERAHFEGALPPPFMRLLWCPSRWAAAWGC